MDSIKIKPKHLIKVGKLMAKKVVLQETSQAMSDIANKAALEMEQFLKSNYPKMKDWETISISDEGLITNISDVKSNQVLHGDDGGKVEGIKAK